MEHALRAIPQLDVVRDGDAIIARTNLGRAERVILAGHLDTVPLPVTEGSLGTVPSYWSSGAPGEGILYGRGATDMKGGVAVQLALAATMFDAGAEPDKDVTFVFYDHEEVEAVKSGLGRLVRRPRGLLGGEFAILLEPTAGTVEGGCNGTSRFEATTRGSGPFRPRLDGQQRDPRRGADPGPAGRLRAADHHRGRAGLPGEPECREDQRRHRRQRHSGPLRRGNQLPLRAGQDARPG